MAAELINYRYELRTKLSQTGLFTSWKAYDRIGERDVVVKLLNHPVAENDPAARRWTMRLGRQRSIRMPGMAKLLDCGRERERLYVVREFVEGPTLEQWMTRPHELGDVLRVLAAVTQRVAQWHEAGAAHGYLHPANIVLTRNGPVFCDYDIAAATHGILGRRRPSRQDEVYLAPEVRQEAAIGWPSDVYSVGVALWESLTGRRLVVGARDVPAPSRVDPELPASVDVVVEGMLRPQPDDRYPASQAAEALNKLRSRAEPQAVRTPREVRRQRAREQREAERKPLPWPVVVTLVFYRFLFIMLGTAVVTGLTMAGLSLASYQYLIDSMPDEVIVPDVRGMPQDEARTLFEQDLGLKFEVAVEQASKTVAEDAVITTDPGPGRHVKEGRTIRVVVSSGPNLVTVPRLVDGSFTQAQDTLQRLGLQIGFLQRVNNETVPAGYVLTQDPSPGKRVESGTKVSMKISDGPKGERPGDSSDAAADTDEETGAARRTGKVRIAVPPTPRYTWVRIEVRDDRGDRTVYNELHSAGDVVTKNVEGVGETVVDVYLNDSRVETKVL